MCTIAARKAAQIVGNVQKVIALEYLCAAQALSLRLAMTPTARAGAASERLLAAIRRLEIAPGRRLAVLQEDVPLAPYIAALVAWVRGEN